MALFTRDPSRKIAKAAKTYQAARALVDATEKGVAGYAMNGATGSSVIPYVPGQPYNFGPGDTGNPSAGQVVPLVRPFEDYGAVMGPAFPLLPAAIDEVLDSSGRPLPRLYQYRIAENLDLTFQNQPWNVLRSLVETCDLVHRAAEIRIADITRMDISFSLTDEAIDSIMVDQGVTHAKAARIGREKYGEQISMLENFWENPYPQLHRSYNEWITEFLWNHLTYDGTPVYPRFSLGGKCMGLELIDPSTIKVLLDNRGGRPLPPAPAFQQILWDFPRGEFVSDPEDVNDPDKPVKNLYDGAGRDGAFKTDQLGYFKRNPRTWSAYGYSVVEECIPAATLWLERQAWLLADYQQGSMAAGYIEAPSDKIDIKNISAWNRILNDRLNGQTGQRQQMQYIPEGSKVTFAPTNESRYKADLDEYVIKRVAAIFGVSPQTLGVVPHAGMGGGKGAQEGEAENAESISQKPMLNFLTDMMNSCSRRWLGSDKNVTAVFNDVDAGSQGDLIAAQANQIALYSGQKTLNDVQEAAGRPSYEMPEADEPFIVTGNTIQFLNGLLAQDAAGEVTGQVDGASDGQAQGAPVQGKPEEQVNSKQPEDDEQHGDSGQTPPAVVDDKAKLAELQTFGRFVRRANKNGKYSKFVFNTIEDTQADALNDKAYFIVKGAAAMPANMTEWALETMRVSGEILKGPSTLESVS
jgi:hypothetical protein